MTAASVQVRSHVTGLTRRAWGSLQLRLAVVYAGLIFVAGVALIAIANGGLRFSASQATPILLHRGPLGQVTIRPANSAIAAVEHANDVHWVAIFSAIGLVVIIVLAVVVGWLLAGRLLRPLRTMTASARDISATSLDRRLGVDGPKNELTELAGTLDELFGRLESTFISQRHFVANASHELRTPVAAERAVLQVALADPDASLESLRAACEEALRLEAQQERLIGGLLTLATSERGIEWREPFDVATVARGVLKARGEEAARRRLRVTQHLISAPATGDPSLAESLVANLVDNAIRYNSDGGELEVLTGPSAGGTGALLVVRNRGQVVDPGELDRLFRPFERSRAARTHVPAAGEADEMVVQGHGLGLPIVRAIVEAHGGTVTARVRPEGGLEVAVTLP